MSLIQSIQQNFHSLETSWKYADKSIKLGKNGLSLLLEILDNTSCLSKGLESGISLAIFHAKYTNFVDIPLNLKEATQELFTISSLLQINDFEGISLTLGGLGVLAMDTLDSALTASKMVTLTAGSALIQPLLALETPLSLLILGGSLTMGIIKTSQSQGLFNELEALLEEKPLSQEKLKSFLESKVQVTEEESFRLEEQLANLKKELGSGVFQKQLQEEIEHLKSNKMEKLLRRGNPVIYRAFQELLRAVDSKKPLNDEDAHEILRILGNVQASLGSKLSYLELSSLATLLALAGVLLFLTPIAPLIPLTLLTASAALKLWLLIEKDNYQNSVPVSDCLYHNHVDRLRQLFEARQNKHHDGNNHP